MFDPDWLDRLSGAIAEGCAADLSEASTGQLREVLINVQSELDCLQGLHARAVAAFEARDGHRVDGCGSMVAWLRRHLRMSGAETRARRRAAAALVQLPEVRQAVEAGRIRPAHVDVFATGVKRVGAKLMRDHQAILLPVAEACDPAELLTAVDRLRDTIDPDAADRDWAQAQEKYDFNLHRVGHGWNVSGYLDPTTGSKLQLVLDAVAAPAGADDDRPVARRRVEGMAALLSSILDSGTLPSDKGIRPHLAVTVDLQTLRSAVRGDRSTPSAPAFLSGYGLIGRDLLSRLACDAALSVVLTETTDAAGRSPYRHVLDVGRVERLATAKQRLAILIQQGFRCATAGCHNTHLEIHHIIAWLDGGPTDLHNLAGFCVGCHHLIHAGQLTCRRDGDGVLHFTTRGGVAIPDDQRQAIEQFRRGLDPPNSAA